MFSHANNLQYADKKEKYVIIKCFNKYIKLQEDLTRLFICNKLNKLVIHISKCHKSSFTRNKNKIYLNYNFNDTHINGVKYMRDFGVVQGVKQNFPKHANEAINKMPMRCWDL